MDLADSLWARLEQGALASFASTGSKLPGGGDILELRIFGARGHVLFDVGGGTASVTLEGRTRELEPLSEPERYPQYAPAGNLVDICLGRGANGSPGDVGLATVDLVSAMYRSAGQGGVPVEIAATG